MKPFFSTKGDYQSNRKLLVLFFVFKLAKAITIAVLYSYLSTFMGLLSLPVITYQLFFQHLVGFLGNICLLGAFETMDYFTSHKLKLSLQESINNDLKSRWLKGSAVYGIKAIPSKHKIDPNKVLRDDTFEFVDLSFKMLEELLKVSFGFLFGIYQLWMNSIALTLNILGREIALPGLMAIGSMLYALGYNYSITLVMSEYPKLCAKEKERDAQMQNVIFHIDDNREAIALLDTADKETHFYNKVQKALLSIRNQVLATKMKFSFIKLIHDHLSDIIGVLIAAPSIIAKQILVTDVFENNYHFKNIIHFFTATQSNTKTLTQLQTSMNRIGNFEKALRSWEELSKIKPELSDAFQTIHLTVETPLNGKKVVLLEDISLQFEQGKITLLEGPNGKGKSTLFRTIAGIWPYAQGRCTIPFSPEEMHIIPQTPCLPYHSTLLEAILYPLHPSEIPKRDTIKAMMKELGLADKIQLLDTKAHWQSELSGGQRQQIAILGAVLKKPKLLLLDEAFGALDKHKKAQAQTFIKQNLPKATLLVIDHQPNLSKKSVTPFYDQVFELKNKKIVPKKRPAKRPILT